ncbi:MAG: phosphofructokinase, partial [Kordiimonadaceae bacterium]|nr:phosphofructokinase [Kordiimonadaceae bacterium]
DALDKLAATSFGTMAIQMIEQKNYGKMTAIVDGNYAVTNNNCVLSEQTTPLVSNLYDAKNYRPEIKNILGRPMYL